MADDKRTVSESDWARFGLNRPPAMAGGGADQSGPDEGHVTYPHHAPYNPDELFGQEQQKEMDDRPWWKANFFIKEPILFGTWDGVFTSVMINIFGVIVFLRTGWMVANAGIGQAVLILFLCMLLALMPILSAIGICERCQIQSGGVYFLISHILGGQIGGAVGVLYAFGQAVATALVAIGFGESMASVFNSNSGWVVRFIALIILILLVGINVMGVKWVIKLQLALLGLLMLAALDLTIGSFFREGDGVVGYSSENWRNNTEPDYDASSGQNFFTVFGVYFATFTGVLAGVNMSGDLKEPSKNIPVGQLTALAASTSICLLFILVLGGVCDRLALHKETLIAEKVAATKILFLAGLYVSSLSSILGSLYGAPRVLQSIAAENVIPFMKKLEAGKGPNKVPVWATIVMTGVSILFILIRDMNTLAVIATMPFLLTYAFVNYSYVSLAMTYDLQQQRDGRIPNAGIPASYGSMDRLKAATMAAQGNHSGSTGDLDHLFPERQKKFPFQTGPPPPPPSSDPEKNTLVDQQPLTDPAAPDGGPALLDKAAAKPTIIHQPRSWYSFLCNRWLALVGAVVNLIIIFLVHPLYAFAHLLMVFVLFVYIGQASPGVFPGISEFSIPHSIQVVMSRFRGGGDAGEVVVAPLHPGVDTLASTLTEDNTDYAQRKQYHQAKTEEMDDFD